MHSFYAESISEPGDMEFRESSTTAMTRLYRPLEKSGRVDHLIIVCCHAICLGGPANGRNPVEWWVVWFLFQNYSSAAGGAHSTAFVLPLASLCTYPVRR